jgi:hypothetical protein
LKSKVLIVAEARQIAKQLGGEVLVSFGFDWWWRPNDTTRRGDFAVFVAFEGIECSGAPG